MTAQRLLYLHYQHLAVAGQRAIAGSRLLDFLKAELDQVITAHMVVEDDSTKTCHPSFLDDAVSLSEIKRNGVNVIYCEGGIESSFGEDEGRVWKLRKPQIEEFVRSGGTLIVADVDWNFACTGNPEFSELFSAWFGSNHKGSTPSDPIYLVDPGRSQDSGWRRISVDVDATKARIEDWLKPVFDGVSELMVDGPLELRGYQSPLAFVISDTMGSMCEDSWWSSPHKGFNSFRLRYHPNGPMGPDFCGPFASVRQLGKGFLVTITGLISPDSLVTKCPGNAVWIKNLASHLTALSDVHSDRFGFQQFRGSRVFLSHRSADKPAVEAVGRALRRRGVEVWLDKEQILPSDSLGLSINGGLAESSHFALFWSRNCQNAPWVEFELGAAISACVEQKKPIFVIALDETPVPRGIRQFVRISRGDSSEETADGLANAITALNRRASTVS